MTKHIFVTGGVCSSLGKGLNAASIGLLLERRGLRVRLQKLDPYVNVDPGTMNPYEHGEVYVTDDGAETDLDLGHYTRFTDAPLNRDSNVTTGSVYQAVIGKERRGEFLGKTVQTIPHVTAEIKSRIRRLDGPDVDVAISEIGGTVGDIEGLAFLEAIRQFGHECGHGNVLYVHLTLLVYVRAAQELKTKPTQHSVGTLRQIGIFPDVLVCRTEVPMEPDHREKVALFCNVEPECVIEELDAKPNIYQIPLMLRKQGLDALICDRLGLPPGRSNLQAWRRMLKALDEPAASVEVAVVGKYISRQSAYESVYEALRHGGIAHRARVDVRRVESEDVEARGAEACLDGVHGVLVPGGFGVRGMEGKIRAVRHAREHGIPYFGICLGMQCAVIEFARNACGLADADSAESRPDTPCPVVSLMEEQKKVSGLGGTMRLGAQPCVLTRGSRARRHYGRREIRERHRHRYEFNNAYRDALTSRGLRCTGLYAEHDLVEIVELEGHPWFVGVQFHPEFLSKPTAPHPLFAGFIGAALAHAGAAGGRQEPLNGR
ncbi:MAG: CTP synthase [Candidatus Brocadiaceae bacterium]|nr:CTP synthase [Candidatus Brocadiaceae bacterium]